MSLVRLFLVFVIGGYSTFSYSEKGVGYKDLKIGQSMSVVNDHCENVGFSWKCYNSDELRFNFFIQESNGLVPYFDEDHLRERKIDQIFVSFGKTEPVLDLVFLNPESNYNKLKNRFDQKHSRDFEISDKDREMFGGLNPKIFSSYQEGQVILELSSLLDGDIRFRVMYKNPQLGREFLKENRPKKSLNTKDF